MTTIAKVQSHISALIAQDKRDANVVDGYYAKALTVIKSSLQAFFQEYADDTGLSVNIVSQRANLWDQQQFNNAVNLLMDDNANNSDLHRRLMAAQITAQGTHRDALASIITASIAIATAQAQSYGNQSVINSYKNEYKYRSDDPISTNPNIPVDISKNADFNSRVWVHGDTSALSVRQTIDKATKSGIDMDMLKRLTADNHGNVRVDNIDSSAQTGISFNKQLIRFSNITATNKARDEAYQADPNTDYVKFITENDDKVCDICQPLDGQVYALSDAPVPQDDTHLNCRCSLERCDADGNLL